MQRRCGLCGWDCLRLVAMLASLRNASLWFEKSKEHRLEDSVTTGLEGCTESDDLVWHWFSVRWYGVRWLKATLLRGASVGTAAYT